MGQANPLPTDYINDSFYPDTRHWQGREHELAELARWLSDPAVQMVGVKAAGGFGKSALVSKVCEWADASGQASSQPFERVFAVTFSQNYAFSLWGRWLLAHFDERVDDTVGDGLLARLAVDKLRQTRCLLVLDNVETLLTAETRQWRDEGYGQFLMGWLSGQGQSVVVMTSREEPDVPDNLMQYCRWCDLGELAVDACVALLSELGLWGEAPALKAFVQEAGGHPLLLKLAAGWLLVEEPDEPRIEYLDREVDGLNVFEFVGAHRGQPETSVKRILEATLGRLPGQMGALLPAVSVYRLPFSVAAARAMGAAQVTEADLQRLTKRSLLQSKKQTIGTERVRLFEFQPLVQRYLRAKANPSNHQKAIDYYEHIRKPVLNATDDLAATVAYQEMFYHCCELGDYAKALEIIRTPTDEQQRYSSCDMVLQLCGYNAVRLTLYEPLVSRWRPQNKAETGLRADALRAMGDVLQFLDRRDEAIANYDEALGIYRQVGARLGEANTLQAMGRMRHNIQQGISDLQSAQVLYEQIEDKYSQGVNLYYLAQMYRQVGQTDDALVALKTTARLGKEINFEPLVEAAEGAIQSLGAEA